MRRRCAAREVLVVSMGGECWRRCVYGMSAACTIAGQLLGDTRVYAARLLENASLSASLPQGDALVHPAHLTAVYSTEGRHPSLTVDS